MSRTPQLIVTCQICRKETHRDESLPTGLVRPAVAEVIRKEHPQWKDDGYVCLADLNHYRTLYVQQTLEAEKGELTALESDVVRSLREHELLSENLNAQFAGKLTLGQRLADRIARFGGSWTFLLTFAGFLFVWIGVMFALNRNGRITRQRRDPSARRLCRETESQSVLHRIASWPARTDRIRQLSSHLHQHTKPGP